MAKLTVEDQWLRKALQEAAGKKTFSEEDLAEITELDWSEYRAEAGEPWGAIEDIEPLKACTALKILSFDGNHISDLSPLANCAQLEEVWLVSSAVSDLTPLSTCRKLRILNLDSNYQLEDITPLRGLPALTQLMLSSTRVRDITPLLDLPALKDVSLYSLFRLEPGSEAFKVMAELLRRGVKVGHEDIEIVQASVREGQDAPAAGASLVERLKALSAFEVARAIESFGLNGQGDDGDQKTPLHLAVRWDDFSADPVTDRLAVVRELLAEPGIVVDSLNRLEETPLTAYLKHNRRADAAMARLLLDAGADPNARSHWGDMPLRSAIEAECPAVVDVLIERGAKWLDPSIVNTFASKGMLERVRAALEAGYDVNSKDENSGNSTLLHMAAFGGQPEVVRFLLERGADVHLRDRTKSTPLLVAHGAECIRLLLEAGAKVNVEDDRKSSPLGQTVSSSNLAGIRLLVEAGADINHRDKYGNTPLHYCLYEPNHEQECMDILNYLIDQGAEVNALNDNKETPMDRYRHPDMRTAIRKRGGKTGKTVLKAQAG
ncbi:MAG TPA: ankyrin repeat domain-containing protein [Anaerolineaceae bacterium]|nr:ankyrin repeat domain-containing protein [Anaerolineaceae bacterium]HPN53361.1 ankyrin repeat domain-containing protein [Anaerolineaceae bacterium]